MEQRKADACVYPALALVASVYAAILDYNKHHARWKIEPDFTWAEVATGTTICLLAAAIRGRLGPNDRQAYERATWLSFIIGGGPVIIWQIWRAYHRQKRRGDALEQHIEERHAKKSKRSPARLAYFRRPGTRANGTSG